MPAVIVVTLNPPEGPAVEPVKPAPIVIVRVSGYFKMTTPDPPDAPVITLGEALAPPPPPPPRLAVPACGARVGFTELAPPP